MNVIHQLPDSVANQIAAGEVVQRPSSVVKELMENALDASATQIKVSIQDAGKTMIQVSDNGCGMSEVDARMAFERHATSKIRSAEDLYRIQTMGFRGEALASIAAVSNVTLTTRHIQSEIGTELQLSGGVVKSQTSVSCAVGSVFSVKNLFFNIPARRKFLKSDQTEFRHITDEFIRIALVNSGIYFNLQHNGHTIFDLPPTNLKQRIIAVFGRNYNENLIDIQNQSSLVSISGFIGNPRHAKKTGGNQFFFVNNRFMRHPFFHRALMNAYERLIPEGTTPSYFITFTVEPETIDVNIHPTKTEIKFEYERDIFQILQSTVKEALGRYNFMPAIDFDNPFESTLAYQPPAPNTPIQIPKVRFNPNYNPFVSKETANHKTPPNVNHAPQFPDWKQSLINFEKTPETGIIPFDEIVDEKPQRIFLQIKKRYILTTVKSGIMIIDQHRAHFQIIYEELKQNMKSGHMASQVLMFPLELELEMASSLAIDEVSAELKNMGFEWEKTSPNGYKITNIPAILDSQNIGQFLEEIAETVKNSGENINEILKERFLQNLASLSAVPYGKELSMEEMCSINDHLFGCHSPTYTCDGKKIIQTFTEEEITELFNKI